MMNSLLFRPLLRTSALRQGPFIVATTHRAPIPLLRPQSSILKPTILQLRSVASSVSGRPGSQTLEHAATNVKEELGNSATDLAKVIAGANMTSDSVVDHSGDSFVCNHFPKRSRSLPSNPSSNLCVCYDRSASPRNLHLRYPNLFWC